MSKYVIDNSTLVSIADAVREKDGTTAPIVVSDLATRIKAIPQEGGGGVELPAEAFTITGDCDYRFTNNGWNWFINMFGDKVITKDISDCGNMFYNCSRDDFTTIPFNINVSKKCVKYGNMFDECRYLTKAPLILPQETIPPPTGAYSGMIDIGSMFYYCQRLREVPYDIFNNLITQEYYDKAITFSTGGRGNLFGYCYSLREHPDLTWTGSGGTSSSSLYYGLFRYCYALNEVIDLPVIPANYTNNYFRDTFLQAGRLKNITFKTNEDGSPIAVAWKNQAISAAAIGFTSAPYYITGYNSGITADKEVKDDATYQALKNDEDWWSADINYSRYNHDSAVATINSLPDVSAGSGNTIKFNGEAGALTDGGAINTLTEEEIAVAAAKGWTVSFV